MANEIKSINGRKVCDEKAREDIASIVIPSKLSELTNDSGFITADDIPSSSEVPATDAEIEEIYNQYKDTCAGYESFIVGYTQTVSCDQYIYVYVASTTNATTGDYVENTFVLSKEDGTFKVDGKTDGAKAYLQQAPTKMAQ